MIDSQRYDIALDSNGDLFFGVTGDFAIVPSDAQHIADTINAAPNTWKEYPNTGVNIRMYLGGPVDPQKLSQTTRLQLAVDAYTNCSPLCLLSSDGILYLAPNVTLNNGQTQVSPIIPLSN